MEIQCIEQSFSLLLVNQNNNNYYNNNNNRSEVISQNSCYYYSRNAVNAPYYYRFFFTNINFYYFKNRNNLSNNNNYNNYNIYNANNNVPSVAASVRIYPTALLKLFLIFISNKMILIKNFLKLSPKSTYSDKIKDKKEKSHGKNNNNEGKKLDLNENNEPNERKYKKNDKNIFTRDKTIVKNYTPTLSDIDGVTLMRSHPYLPLFIAAYGSVSSNTIVGDNNNDNNNTINNFNIINNASSNNCTNVGDLATICGLFSFETSQLICSFTDNYVLCRCKDAVTKAVLKKFNTVTNNVNSNSNNDNDRINDNFINNSNSKMFVKYNDCHFCTCGNGRISNIIFSPSGNKIIIMGSHGNVSIWELSLFSRSNNNNFSKNDVANDTNNGVNINTISTVIKPLLTLPSIFNNHDFNSFIHEIDCNNYSLRNSNANTDSFTIQNQLTSPSSSSTSSISLATNNDIINKNNTSNDSFKNINIHKNININKNITNSTIPSIQLQLDTSSGAVSYIGGSDNVIAICGNIYISSFSPYSYFTASNYNNYKNTMNNNINNSYYIHPIYNDSGNNFEVKNNYNNVCNIIDNSNNNNNNKKSQSKDKGAFSSIRKIFQHSSRSEGDKHDKKNNDANIIVDNNNNDINGCFNQAIASDSTTKTSFSSPYSFSSNNINKNYHPANISNLCYSCNYNKICCPGTSLVCLYDLSSFFDDNGYVRGDNVNDDDNDIKISVITVETPLQSPSWILHDRVNNPYSIAVLDDIGRFYLIDLQKIYNSYYYNRICCDFNQFFLRYCTNSNNKKIDKDLSHYYNYLLLLLQKQRKKEKKVEIGDNSDNVVICEKNSEKNTNKSDDNNNNDKIKPNANIVEIETNSIVPDTTTSGINKYNKDINGKASTNKVTSLNNTASKDNNSKKMSTNITIVNNNNVNDAAKSKISITSKKPIFTSTFTKRLQKQQSQLQHLIDKKNNDNNDKLSQPLTNEIDNVNNNLNISGFPFSSGANKNNENVSNNINETSNKNKYKDNVNSIEYNNNIECYIRNLINFASSAVFVPHYNKNFLSISEIISNIDNNCSSNDSKSFCNYNGPIADLTNTAAIYMRRHNVTIEAAGNDKKVIEKGLFAVNSDHLVKFYVDSIPIIAAAKAAFDNNSNNVNISNFNIINNNNNNDYSFIINNIISNADNSSVTYASSALASYRYYSNIILSSTLVLPPSSSSFSASPIATSYLTNNSISTDTNINNIRNTPLSGASCLASLTHSSNTTNITTDLSFKGTAFQTLPPTIIQSPSIQSQLHLLQKKGKKNYPFPVPSNSSSLAFLHTPSLFTNNEQQPKLQRATSPLSSSSSSSPYSSSRTISATSTYSATNLNLNIIAPASSAYYYYCTNFCKKKDRRNYIICNDVNNVCSNSGNGLSGIIGGDSCSSFGFNFITAAATNSDTFIINDNTSNNNINISPLIALGTMNGEVIIYSSQSLWEYNKNCNNNTSNTNKDNKNRNESENFLHFIEPLVVLTNETSKNFPKAKSFSSTQRTENNSRYDNNYSNLINNELNNKSNTSPIVDICFFTAPDNYNKISSYIAAATSDGVVWYSPVFSN